MTAYSGLYGLHVGYQQSSQEVQTLLQSSGWKEDAWVLPTSVSVSLRY